MVQSTPLQQVDYLTQTHWTLISNPYPNSHPDPNPSTNMLPNSIKICLLGDVYCSWPKHVTRVSWLNFQACDFTVGQIFDFPIDFCMDLSTVRR